MKNAAEAVNGKRIEGVTEAVGVIRKDLEIRLNIEQLKIKLPDAIIEQRTKAAIDAKFTKDMWKDKQV